MSKKTIAILGAGFSGVFATHTLAKKLKDRDDITIKLINKDPYFTYKTRLHEVIGGRIEPTDALHDLEKLSHPYKNVEIIIEEVESVDDQKQIIYTSSDTHAYDYVILAMGGEPNDFGIRGVKEYGFTMWSWEEAVMIRKQILSMVQQAALELEAEKRRSMLHFVVCGGGLTGIEIMGELIEWKPVLEKNFGLQKDEISLTLVEATSKILPALPEKEAERVKAYFNEHSVNILTEASVSEVTPVMVKIKDQNPLSSYTLIWTAGVKANSDIKNLSGEFKKSGRLAVHPTLEAKELQNIFVVGDLGYLEDKDGNPLPQNVQTAATASENILSRLNGSGVEKSHENKQQGSIVSVGTSYGVGYLMDKVHIKGNVAVFMKHIVNFRAWINMGSFKNAVKYSQQEMKALKNDRYIS